MGGALVFATTLSDPGVANATFALGDKPRNSSHHHWDHALSLHRRGSTMWSDLAKRAILIEADAAQPKVVLRQIERWESAWGSGREPVA